MKIVGGCSDRKSAERCSDLYVQFSYVSVFVLHGVEKLFIEFYSAHSLWH